MATLERLTETHSAQRAGVIELLIRALLGLWSGFGRWDDEQAVYGMAARSASLVDASNAKVRRMQRTYLSAVFREMGVDGRSLPPVVDAYPRANVGATEVYTRPVDQFIWARRNGLSFDESHEAFANRLQTIAEMDARAAERDEATRIYEAVPEVIGHRRVIHPELSESGLSCGLCVVAARQFYVDGDLEPLHDGCNCDTLPITATDDPGFRLNDDDLQRMYAIAGSTAAEDLINTRISINEHGELGPILVKHGDHFKTAEEAGRPKWVKPTPATIRRDRLAERADLVEQMTIAQQRYDAGGLDDDVRVPLFRSIRYMRERITQIDSFLSSLAA